MPKNKTAGKRLKIAREFYGFTQEEFPAKVENWEKIVKVYDAKTIRAWEKEGIPDKKIALVAKCLKILPSDLTDADLNDDYFLKKIQFRISNSEEDDQDSIDINEGRLIPVKEIYEALKLAYETGKTDNNAEFFHDRGLKCYQNGEYDHAIIDFNRAVEIDPNYAEAFRSRGICHRIKGDFEQALADHDVSITIRKAETYHARSVVLLYKGDYDESLEEAKKSIKTKPDYFKPYINLGILYKEKGDYQQALENYHKAIELDPQNAITYTNLGILYRKMGEHKKAIESYHKAIEIDPQYGRAYICLGFLYKKKDEHKRAIENYKKAIEIDPQYDRAYNSLGTLYRKIGDYKKALENYHKAIELDPQNVTAYTNLGILYRKMGEHKKAIESYHKAIEIDPQYDRAYNNLSWIYSTCINADYRNSKKAVKTGLKAVELSCSSLNLNTLAAAYAEAGKFEKAIETQKKAIKIIKSNNYVEQLDLNIKCLKNFKAHKPWRDKS